MFEKLLSLLPYNPSLGHQLAFYGRRMREEAAIRRVGLIFVGLAFLIQFVAVISPPQASVADSTNDLVDGGFSSAAEAAADCRSNIGSSEGIGYGSILANYGISCAKVASAPTITIRSTDFNRQLYSMGRNNYNIAGETPVTINGATLWVRYLWGWDTGAPSTYRALNVTTTGGQTFLLLYSCGNLTSVGLPVPVQKPPVLSLNKTTIEGYPAANSGVAPGATLGYTIYVNNSGGTARNVSLVDDVPAYTSLVWAGTGGATYTLYNSNRTAKWVWPQVPNETNVYYTALTVKVNTTAPNGTRICNAATVSSSQTSPVLSNQVCMTVKVTAPKPPAPPPTCKLDNAILASNKLCVVCPTNSSIIASSSQCKPCEQSISSQDTQACVVRHKTAANLTQNISDANNTTAQPGDSILYTLYADNTGKAAVKNYQFQEDLSDVLDYSTVADLYGGSINSNDLVTWPTVTIQPQQTATERVLVKVDNPIPQTPTSTSDPEHFNLVMTNIYSNTININVPGSPVKTIETTAASLPNTGPGTSLFIGAAIMVVAGYFYSRSRLLAKESQLALQETSGA